MADENIKNDNLNEEYHFTEAENVDVYGAKSRTINIFERINRRHILLIIGLIIVALSLYKLLGVFLSSAPTKPKSQEPAPIARIVATAPPKPIVLPKPEEPQPPTTAYKNQVDNLVSNVSQLTDKITSLQETITSMSQRLDTVVQTLDKQQTALDTLTTKPHIISKPKRMVRKVMRVIEVRAPVISYSIQAIIPGRAWLETSTGENITVREGDILAGYGRITRISPVRNIITTSSGAIITSRE